MCSGCWEQYGKPAIVNDKTRMVAAFLEVNSSEYCCLHITTSDFNIEDEHIEFCLAEARDQGHPECEALALYFRDLSVPERASALAIEEGWVSVPIQEADQ